MVCQFANHNNNNVDSQWCPFQGWVNIHNLDIQSLIRTSKESPHGILKQSLPRYTGHLILVNVVNALYPSKQTSLIHYKARFILTLSIQSWILTVDHFDTDSINALWFFVMVVWCWNCTLFNIACHRTSYFVCQL